MFSQIVRWFKGEPASEEWPAIERRASSAKGRRRTDVHATLSAEKHAPSTEAPKVRTVRPGTARNGVRRAMGPAQKSVIRNRYVREETGTHETLKILDDSILDSGDDGGIDPYNSGEFDRSRNWERHFRG